MRSRARLGRALRLDQLNRPKESVVAQQIRPAEAGVTLAAVGIEELERGSPARWAGSVAGDEHLRSLPDDVPAEPDPRPASQLQPDTGRLADGAGEAAGSARFAARRLEHDQADARTASKRGHARETVREARGAGRARRQVDDQQVHRPARQQRAGDRQALLRIGRRHDDEPLELDATSRGLDRVERRREVQPRDDRAGRLCLSREPQGERRPPARGVAPQRDAHPAWHAAGPEDRVELGEARREDAARVRLWLRDG